MPIEWTAETRNVVGDLAERLDSTPRSFVCVCCDRPGHSATNSTGVTVAKTCEGAVVVRLTHQRCRPSTLRLEAESIDIFADDGCDAEWACGEVGGEPLLVVSFRPAEMFVLTDSGLVAAGIAGALQDGATLPGFESGQAESWWSLRVADDEMVLSGRHRPHLIAPADNTNSGWVHWWSLARKAGVVKIVMAYGLDFATGDTEQQMERLAGEAMLVEHFARIVTVG